MYIEQNSEVAKSLASLLIYRRSLEKGHVLRLPIMTIACFVKNTIGYNSYFEQDNFLFKDENEWRYIPTKNKIGGGYISESRSTFLKNPDGYNNKLSNYHLEFNINEDITCIYCANNKECKELIIQFPYLKERIKIASWQLE